MNRPGLAVLLGTLAVAACSHPREPSDAQLTMLLRAERAAPTDANAQLDAAAVGCLRAWSADAGLAAGLPAPLATADGKKQCRDRLQGWFADAARNPAHFTFEEIGTPAVARRAMTLQATRALTSLPGANHQPPSALTKRPAPASMAPPPDDANVDLGVAGASLKQAEALCRQVQQKAGTGDAVRAQRFGAYCTGKLRQLHSATVRFAKAGNTTQLGHLATEADTLAATAREVLAAADAR
jgi:hypothetical protein